VRGDCFLDEALSDFSGYIAADEIYDGPFCILFPGANAPGRAYPADGAGRKRP